MRHHGLEAEDAEFSERPVNQCELKTELQWSDESQVTRHMENIFGKKPMTNYKRMLAQKQFDELKTLLTEHVENLNSPA